jgi:hypothetical protein
VAGLGAVRRLQRLRAVQGEQARLVMHRQGQSISIGPWAVPEQVPGMAGLDLPLRHHRHIRRTVGNQAQGRQLRIERTSRQPGCLTIGGNLQGAPGQLGQDLSRAAPLAKCQAVDGVKHIVVDAQVGAHAKTFHNLMSEA